MSENFEGFLDSECGEHRTLGGRAWCFNCSSYCYPNGPCLGCELPALRAECDRYKREAEEWKGLAHAAKAQRDILLTAEQHLTDLLGAVEAHEANMEADLYATAKRIHEARGE